MVPFIFLLFLNFEEKEAKGVPALPQTSTTMEEKTHFDLVKGSSIFVSLIVFYPTKVPRFHKKSYFKPTQEKNILIYTLFRFSIYLKEESKVATFSSSLLPLMMVW